MKTFFIGTGIPEESSALRAGNGVYMADGHLSEVANLTDTKTLRERARRHMQEGAVTEGYLASRDEVLRLLNEALATELVCNLRYRRHFFMAMGVNSEAVRQEFREHADQEEEHADLLAERIVQLGGYPDFDPDSLSERSHAEYVEGDTLESMIRENLVAERIAIDNSGWNHPVFRRQGSHQPQVAGNHPGHRRRTCRDLSSLLKDIAAGDPLDGLGKTPSTPLPPGSRSSASCVSSSSSMWWPPWSRSCGA